MAGEINTWLGGATAVTQVETFTLNNDFNDSETDITITMTAEDGTTTQTVSITPSGTDESTIATALQVALAASTESMFTAVTWTVATTVVTGTAVVSGVPFYAASSVTGGTGTITDAISTASAGPNDWNTAANWSRASVPVDTEHVKISNGAHSILYGLNQNAVDLRSFRVTKGFTGDVGDVAGGYYLKINSSDTTGSNTPYTVIASGGTHVWIDGGHDTVYVTRTSRVAKAVKIKESTIVDLYIMGPEVAGTVTLTGSLAIQNIRCVECPGSKLVIESAISALNTVTMNNAGRVELSTTPQTGSGDLIELNGGTLIIEDNFTGGAVTLNVRGGECIFRGDQTDTSTNTLTALNVYGGLMDLREIETFGMTISATNVYGGTYDDRSGHANITQSANIIRHGGIVLTDTASIVAVSF